MAKEEYKDILGFTWKKEGDRFVQYKGDGTRTGKTKLVKDVKNQASRGVGAKTNNKKKVDRNNPRPGDTKKTQRRRVGGKWIGGDTVVWNGSKWVPKGDPSLVPNRAVPGDNKADLSGYNRTVKVNESLKINKKNNNNNSQKNVSDEKNNEKNNDKDNEKKVNNNGGPNLEAANQILSGNKKEITMKDFQSDSKTDKTDNKKTKESKWIRNPKTKTLVSRTSQKGKQLLKIEERKRKLKEKRFGKK